MENLIKAQEIVKARGIFSDDHESLRRRKHIAFKIYNEIIDAYKIMGIPFFEVRDIFQNTEIRVPAEYFAEARQIKNEIFYANTK